MEGFGGKFFQKDPGTFSFSSSSSSVFSSLSGITTIYDEFETSVEPKPATATTSTPATAPKNNIKSLSLAAPAPAPAPAPTPTVKPTQSSTPTPTITPKRKKIYDGDAHWFLNQNLNKKLPSDNRILIACGNVEAVHNKHKDKRKAERYKHWNVLEIQVSHLLPGKIKLDGNFPRRVKEGRIKTLVKDLPLFQRALRPIMKIHKQLVELEQKRQKRTSEQEKSKKKEVLDICLVRLGNGSEEQTAELLTFNDVPTEGIHPLKWEEQTVTIRTPSDGKEHTIGMCRVKAVGEKSIGKGKRNKRPPEYLSPQIPLSSSKKKRISKRKEQKESLPWILPTSLREFGGAPAGDSSSTSTFKDEMSY